MSSEWHNTKLTEVLWSETLCVSETSRGKYANLVYITLILDTPDVMLVYLGDDFKMYNFAKWSDI